MLNYHYNFHTGMNLVSFPFAKALDWESNTESLYTPAELFGDEQIITELIGTAEGVNWISPGVWVGNLLHIDPRESYWVKNNSDTSYEWNFNPEIFVKKTTHYPLTLGVNFIGFPDTNKPLPISEAFTEEDLNYIESIVGEAETVTISDRYFVGNLNEFKPGHGYIFTGKNLAPAEPGVEGEIYNLTFFRETEPKPPTTVGPKSRGRYLIVVAEDTDLAGIQSTYPHMAQKNWGEPFNGGGDANNILKRFSNGILWGNNAGVRMYTEDNNVWPYTRETHERMPQGENFSLLGHFPAQYVQPDTENTIVVNNSDRYIEPLVNTNFIEYLKSRGFIVDVAVMDRRMRYYENDWHYTGAHPEDVPDLTVIPYVTEDWSQLRHTHPDLDQWQHISGETLTGGKGKFWSSNMLNIHLQYFKNKYKGTDHPLKYVLFLGEPCSAPTLTAGGLQRATQCIPFFGTPSYTYTMDDVSDWPYTWFTSEYYQSLYKFNYGENGENVDESPWVSLDEFNAVMSWNTYDDVITLLEEGFGNDNGMIEMQNFQSSTNVYDQLANSNLYPEEWFMGMNSIYEADFYIGRIMTKEPGNSYTDRQKHLMFQLQHTIGYHNFQHLYLNNTDVCVSVDEYWIHNDEYSDDVILGGYCRDSEERCFIRKSDAIWAGCSKLEDTGLNDYCIALSPECGNWDATEYYKEYLGNSVHIGVNYSN